METDATSPPFFFFRWVPKWLNLMKTMDSMVLLWEMRSWIQNKQKPTCFTITAGTGKTPRSGPRQSPWPGCFTYSNTTVYSINSKNVLINYNWYLIMIFHCRPTLRGERKNFTVVRYTVGDRVGEIVESWTSLKCNWTTLLKRARKEQACKIVYWSKVN